MAWEVEFTDEFEEFFTGLNAEEQESVDFYVTLLEQKGPLLKRPYADTVYQSRFSNMKELRVQHAGRPLRIFFAFDPRQVGVLLIGGDKTGDDRFYEVLVPKADGIYQQHLNETGSG